MLAMRMARRIQLTIRLTEDRAARFRAWRRTQGIDGDSPAIEWLIDNRLEEIMADAPRAVSTIKGTKP